MGYGLVMQSTSTSTPYEGLLIRQPKSSLLPSTVTFVPIEPSAIDWLQKKSEITLVAPKAENLPQLYPLGTITSPNDSGQTKQFYGVLGISPSAEANITYIEDIIVNGKGRFLQDDEENAFLLSANSAEDFDASVGDEFVLKLGNVEIEIELVGIFDDDRFIALVDLDGEPMTPKKLEMEEAEEPEIILSPCDPSETIIVTWRTAVKLYGSLLSRITVQVKEEHNLLSFSRRIALERDYWIWAVTKGETHFTGLRSYLEAEGLPILVPWIIAILGVITTMLNSIFERRREISVLSSIGLNPSHITILFVAEALIIGAIGGGVGYMAGLGTYKLMSNLSIAVEVRQKVSAMWVAGSLGIAATVVLIGAIVAVRSSVIVTPSLLRSWRIEKQPVIREPWSSVIPLRLLQNDIDPFFNHVTQRLERSKDDFSGFSRIRPMEEWSPPIIKRGISFTYYSRDRAGGMITRNKLLAEKMEGEEFYTLKLSSTGEEAWVYKTTNFIRRLVLEWSTMEE
jgi:hypothetical protein